MINFTKLQKSLENLRMQYDNYFVDLGVIYQRQERTQLHD